MQRILGLMRKAIQQFQMIDSGDHVVVGVSGGKDSIALLSCLNQYKKFSPVSFSISALTIDLGFDDMDFSPIDSFCREQSIPYYIEKTEIGPIIFEARHEKNPCSLCAKMRRGALFHAAHEIGGKKVALAHHQDDIVETFFMSLFYEGRLNTMLPVINLDDIHLKIIRPFVFVKEKEIVFDDELKKLPKVINVCPADGHTKRAAIKNWLKQTRRSIPTLDKQVMRAIQNDSQLSLWFNTERNYK